MPLRRSQPVLLLIALFVIGSRATVRAQLGDAKDPPGTIQKEVWRRWNVPPAPPLSPEDALKSFRVAPGFRLELVAAEPLVEDPVAIAWDADGRIWVAEMRGWMRNVDGDGEHEPVGQVAVLEDLDGDGHIDRRVTFLDELVMPRAVAPVQGGVLVAVPPKLLFCSDTDDDLKADHCTSVAHYGSTANPEHTDNGLMLSLDNWMYSAKSEQRLKFRNGNIIREETNFRGQWGITQDDNGRIYTNNNSHYLYVDLFPFHYLARNVHLPFRRGMNRRAIVTEEHPVHPIRVNPGINRGYAMVSLREDGRVQRPESASGPVIYRGDQFPSEFYGNAFVPLPAANAVAGFVLREDDLGFEVRHRLYPDARWGKREFLASTDERFRPVNLYTGPDGCLYVVDLYRGILEHRIYMTTYLRKQILERGLDKPLGLGRIYRVVWEASTLRDNRPSLSKSSSETLTRHLSHPNGWWRDTAQRLLVERRDRSIIAALEELVRDSSDPVGLIHGLWTLEGMDALEEDVVLRAMQDFSPRVREAALRVSDSLDKRNTGEEFLRRTEHLVEDPDPRVRIQAVFSLGEFHGDGVDGVVRALLRHGTDPYLRQAALSAVPNRELAVLVRLLEDFTDRSGMREVVADFASTIFNSREIASIEKMFELIAATPDKERRVALLDGILRIAREDGYTRVMLSGEPNLTALRESSSPGINARVEELIGATTWEGDPRLAAGGRPLAPLTRQQKKLAGVGRSLYGQYCAVCHRDNGAGQSGVAPSLRSTDWILGEAEPLIKITLQGMTGPVTIGTESWDETMPGFVQNPLFDDAGVAGLLTFLRRQWGNSAQPIEVDTVRSVRQATGKRTEPWTAEELRKSQ